MCVDQPTPPALTREYLLKLEKKNFHWEAAIFLASGKKAPAVFLSLIGVKLKKSNKSYFKHNICCIKKKKVCL